MVLYLDTACVLQKAVILAPQTEMIGILTLSVYFDSSVDNTNVFLFGFVDPGFMFMTKFNPAETSTVTLISQVAVQVNYNIITAKIIKLSDSTLFIGGIKRDVID